MCIRDSSDTGRTVRENRMRSGSADGYVVVEAAVLLPLASLIMVLLVWLGSYLYQSCFLSQAAYIAAFRGSRFPERGAGYVQRELEELMDGEVLRFSEESFRVDSGIPVSYTHLMQNIFHLIRKCSTFFFRTEISAFLQDIRIQHPVCQKSICLILVCCKPGSLIQLSYRLSLIHI